MRSFLNIGLFAFIQLQLKAQIIAPNHSFSFSPVLGAHTYEDQNHLFQDLFYGFDAVYSNNISQNKEIVIHQIRIINWRNKNSEQKH